MLLIFFFSIFFYIPNVPQKTHLDTNIRRLGAWELKESNEVVVLTLPFELYNFANLLVSGIPRVNIQANKQWQSMRIFQCQLTSSQMVGYLAFDTFILSFLISLTCVLLNQSQTCLQDTIKQWIALHDISCTLM